MPFATRVLLVGDKVPAELKDSMQSTSRWTDLPTNRLALIDVLILPILVAQSTESRKYLHLIQAQNPGLQVILIAARNHPPAEIQECLNYLPVFQIIETLNSLELQNALLPTLEQSQQLRQKRELESLVRDQNERLRNIHRELEERVQRRQTYLEEARGKSTLAHGRWSLLVEATAAIQRAESIGAIEQSLFQLLQKDLGLLSLRIHPHPQDQMVREQYRQQKNHSTFESTLRPRDEMHSMGSIFYLRPREQPFRRDEIEYLQRLGEIVALAIDRLYQFEQNLALQEHWQATFNAVADPVMILNSNYDVLQHNQAFAQKSGRRMTGNRRCFELMFGRNEPCKGCQLGKNFRLDQSEQNFEVFSQALDLPTTNEHLFVHQYHEMTAQIQMEKKILETARLAEIGTIGSSIAHELNNPLGGMLSFTQLIKLDLPVDHPLYADIVEIESGIRRCRDIVQNLLGFSRNPVKDEKTNLDLREVIDRAVKILELQSRSLGIEIRLTRPNDPILVQGYFGYLTQAVQNILQHSLQNIVEKTKISKSFRGLIDVQFTRTVAKTRATAAPMIEIQILDNGLENETYSHLGLSIAQQILRDHSGIIEFSENSKPFHMAKISIPLVES